ncbi:MAG: glycosyltransferase family 2 protein [Acidobacteriota bacterium]
MESLSVIIPTYNRADAVSRALRSVLGQSRPPDEIVVIDDGSTDETPTRIPREFPHVRFIRQENRGVSAARNRGIREAKGRWLAFLDSDDEWLPRKLERQMDALRRHPEYLICHSDEIWIRRGRRVNPMKKHEKSGGHLFQRCLPLCIISPSATVLHRKLFEEVGPFDEFLPACEDYDLWLRVCALHPVLYVDEPLVVKHGGHEDQLSRRYWGMDRFRIRALEKIVRLGTLSHENRRAATEALLEKIDVYLAGARRRGKWREVAEYERKRKLHGEVLSVEPGQSGGSGLVPFQLVAARRFVVHPQRPSRRRYHSLRPK